MALLTDLLVEHYQSLEDVTIRLGGLTVITGPTGSGKSAIIRALKLAAFNAKGTSYIQHGAESCKVGVGCEEQGWVVAIKRAGKPSDSYRVARLPENPSSSDVDVQDFTKLGGQVPAEVAGLLNLSELNFAAQFDRPYLLDESGAAIARILGRLTNVDLVFEAARKGYAAKLGIARSLDRAQATVAQLTEQVQQYATLPAQRAACKRAEEALVRAQAARQRVDRLQTLLSEAIEAHRVASAARSLVEKLGPPSLAKVEQLAEERDRLSHLIHELTETQVTIAIETGQVGLYARQEEQAHKDIHDALVDAGQCPTCGQAVKEGA